jgi:AcrR family transcriptional regulator
VAQPSNREALLAGAIECLKTKGFARTTARDIASASGANLASIGYHFGSKEELLNEALVRLFEQRNRHVGSRSKASRTDDTPLGFLTSTFRAAGAVFKAPRPIFVAFVEAMAQAERSPEMRSQLADHYRQARQALAEVINSKVGSKKSDTMATMIIALFDGLVLQWLLDPSAVPDGGQLIDALTETMSIALGTPTASRA